MPTPDILYKIVTKEQFTNSQEKDFLDLTSADLAFIHFCTKEQYPRIAQKFAERIPPEPYVILEVQTEGLTGEMRFEPNPGKPEKYFHLYNGRIPMSSVSVHKDSSEDEENEVSRTSRRL